MFTEQLALIFINMRLFIFLVAVLLSALHLRQTDIFSKNEVFYQIARGTL